MTWGFSGRSREVKYEVLMRAFSCVEDCKMLLMWCVYLPCYIMISMYMEYKAGITVLIPIRVIVIVDHEKDAITTNSPPIRLMAGVEVNL